MRHELFASLDDLLELETLTRLAGVPITSVRTVPFTSGESASGSGFYAVETNEGTGPRFVVKLMSLACDWIMRATADVQCREVLVWTTGLLDRLPPQIVHPLVSGARDGEGWATLMRNVSDSINLDWDIAGSLSEADHLLILDALAALHTAFWDDPEVGSPVHGFCSPEVRFTAFSPAAVQREIDHPNQIPRMIAEGWEILWSLVEPDLANLVRRLADDPGPLCNALMRFPQTMIHGDPRGANLGILRGTEPRVLVFDWQFSGRSVPGVDLAWYLTLTGFQAPVSRETTIAWYREALARRLGDRFDEAWWQPQLELSLLGQLVRLGWIFARNAKSWDDAAINAWAHEELAWFSERALAAAHWLD